MTEAAFDQEAWLSRIGYAGSTEPTLATLHKLVFAHSRDRVRIARHHARQNAEARYRFPAAKDDFRQTWRLLP